MFRITLDFFLQKNYFLMAVLLFIFPCALKGQIVLGTDTIKVNESYDNIAVKKLTSDKNSTTFLILIKKEVKLHKHQSHSETIYVIEGTGEMRLGEKKYLIKKGDVLFIPENMPHSVKVTSDIPLKVLSVQAPEFDGTDRILLD
jgi:mannose-6-phosphate isomerase-like protein (cupin superfamily)